jgi:hypothetical protein
MVDYVLESNPALERLIERLHVQEELSQLETVPSAETKRFRRRRRSKVHAGECHEQRPADPVPEEASAADHRIAADAVADAEEAHPVVTLTPRLVHPYLQPDEELVLVGFDEEPALFDEPTDVPTHDDAEDLEFLDLFGDQDVDAEDGESGEVIHFDHIETSGEPDCSSDDETDRADKGELVGDEGENRLVDDLPREGSWILSAFEAWRLVEVGGATAHDTDPSTSDEDEHPVESSTDPDQEQVEDPGCVAEPAIGDAADSALVRSEIIAEHYELAAPVLVVSPVAVRTDRKKARHKKQSRRQKERSSRKAGRDAKKAEKAEKASKRTAMKSS